MSTSNAVSEVDDRWGSAPVAAEAVERAAQPASQPASVDPGSAPVTVSVPQTPSEESRPAAILRGSARGLEIVVQSSAPAEAIAAAVNERLAEAPTFFRGSDVRIRVEGGPLAAGCLAKLDDIAVRYALRIVEVGAARARTADDDAVPQVSGIVGSGPGAGAAPAAAPPLAAPASGAVAAPAAPAVPLAAPVSRPLAAPVSRPVAAPLPPDEDVGPVAEHTRVVVGPVRSGVILEHRGHLIVFGDVNPGAEVRAEGNIVVLGRLRGTAHAGIGSSVGFILALRLEPQQLRICRLVARASENDTPGTEPEIAHVTSGGITVERYQGRLPSSLAASI